MQYDRRSLIASLASLPFCQIPFGAARAQQVERPSLKLGVANKAHLYYLPLTLAERLHRRTCRIGARHSGRRQPAWASLGSIQVMWRSKRGNIVAGRLG